MADKWFAILTPAHDLDSAHWLAIERVQPGGPEAVILGLRIRQMAVRAGAGGLLALPDGSPMTLQQITLALGYTLERVQHGLNLLHSFGLAQSGEEGSIWSTDPVVLEHFSREEAAIQKRLPAPGRGPGRPPKVGALTNAERQKKFKNKNKKVTESNEKGNENSGTISVTADEQQPEMIDDISGNENSLIKEGNEVNTSSYTNTGDDDGEIDISPALADVPVAQKVKVGAAVREALRTGHTLHTAHQAIDAARREASPGRPWVGLALYKLKELANPESLPPVKPQKPTCDHVEVVPEEPLSPALDPAADEEFEQAMANPDEPLYLSMLHLTKIAKSDDDGPGKILFKLCMREAFDALRLQPQGLSAPL